jgi:anaerobic magnesium-protoporphyrin IX monomethyl ester cyclase
MQEIDVPVRPASIAREHVSLPDNVCLIIPPSPFLLDERVFMTLGILKIAAVLEQAGVHVHVLDLSGISNYLDVVSDYVRTRLNNIHYGITSTTPQLPAVIKIVKTIRDTNSLAKIILGGPHITLVNAARKREKREQIENGRAHKAFDQLSRAFDVLVAGDGEEAIFMALKEGCCAVIDADETSSPLFLDNKRLTELPFPARHLLDVSSYNYTIENIPATSLIAQLGCPFSCGFCGGRESNMLRKIRMRTSENIVAEMVHIYRTYGIRGFMFYDDELNVNKKMVELMELIAKTQRDLGVEWRLRGFVKSQLVTDEQAKALYNAGFRQLLVGFESGSPAILEAINKKATRDENTRCMDILRRNNLKVKALMSMGHPGETCNTIRESREWLLEAQPADFDVSIITCYPGTPYYDQAVPHRHSDEWVYTSPTGAVLYQRDVDYTVTADYYKGRPDGGYVAYVYTDGLTPSDLVRERDALEQDVRHTLGIPYNRSVAAVRYEHSMGQMGAIPPHILKSSTLVRR